MPTETARAFWITAPGEGVIRSDPLPPGAPDEVRIRSLYSGISRGTETLVFAGRVPPSQYEAMRAPFQAGPFPGPVKYGYLNVGRIEDGPPERVGELVFCLYPHQDQYWVPGSAAIPVPEGVPPERAILAANMETAINAFWDAGPLAGDRIVVVGAGVVGLLTAWLCRQVPGAQLSLIDVNPHRRGPAEALGLAFAIEPNAATAADLVIHASGQPAGLVQALELAGLEATLVELSWYGDRPVTLPLGEAFHARRLTVKSSQVGRIPAHRQARWNHRRRLGLALELLRDDRLDALITGESPFAELPTVLADLSSGTLDGLCHRIHYRESGD